jgi:autotransporter-associated beta strand protein
VTIQQFNNDYKPINNSRKPANNIMKTNPKISIPLTRRTWALKLSAAGILFALAAARPVPAATVTLRQGLNGYAGTTDAWLDESSKRDNNGGDTKLRIQYNSGLSDSTLIRFDLPSLSFQSLSAATLSLYFYDTYSMVQSNALEIKPYRIVPTKSWYENVYIGYLGVGVSWRYRDAAESYSWTLESGAWNDKADDGDGTRWIKPVNGLVPGAIAPTNWVDWAVQPTVAQWYASQENNGFALFENNMVGSGSILAGLFYSRDNSDTAHRPTLAITYAGAAINWGGYASTAWDTSTVNWNVGGYRGTYGDGDFVTFADGASNPGISVAGGDVSPGSVTINNSSTTYNFSNGSINGSGGLTKQGTGLATLSVANGYGGLTLVQGGQLVVAADGALGVVGSGTVVSNGAALGFQGSVTYSAAEPVTISGGGGGGGALYAVSGNNAFAGPVTLAANSTVGVDASLSLALNGAISGGFSLTKTGQGTLTFGGSAANTYGGTTYVNQGMLALVKSAGTAVPNDLVIGDGVNAATVRFGAQGQLCSACDVTVATASQLDLNHHSSTVGSLTLSNGTVASGSGTLSLSGPVSSTGNQTATISGKLNLGGVQREINVANGTAADDLVISAAVSSGAILKTGAGRLVLSGSRTFDGDVVISNGVLAVAASSALGSSVGGTTVANGARLELRNNVSVANEGLTLNGSGGGLGALDNVSDTNFWTGSITLASSSMIECDTGRLSLAGVAGAGYGMTFNISSMGDMLVNGAISGTGSTLTKDGGGQLSLAGNASSTYSGTTRINQGTLALSGSAAIPNSPVIDVTAGATFDVTGVSGSFNLGATAEQTLKGSGTVSGNVAANTLARLEPGDSPGTLTFLNNLSLAAGVTNYFELTNSPAIGGGTNDLIVVAGDLTLSSNVIAITILGSDPLGSGTYRLFNYAGAKTGSFNPTPVFLSGAPGPGSTARIDESVTNQVNLVVVTPIPTFTSVSSAPNPSLPGMAVTITATVGANTSLTNVVPTGSVTFKTNGVPLGPPVPLDNGVAAMATTGVAHGLTTIWAEYPGEGLFLGSTGSVVQLVNAPPVPGYYVAYVMKNEELVLPVAAVVANDYDPDGDPLNITMVSTLSTSNGTAALLSTTQIAYLPKPDYVGSDLITYTLGDPYTNVTGSIHITVLSGGDLTNNIVGITNQGGGAVTLTVTGIPGRTYQVLTVTNLTFPLSWQTLSTNIAGTNGLFQFTVLGATNAEGYYRTATQTNPPDFRLFDAELLRLDIAGGVTTGVMIRESPTLQSLGVTRIRPLTNGTFTICSFFDVFTELSVNSGLTWFPATNAPIPLILVGGTPPNGFPTDSLPPPAGQYITPPGWPEFYQPPAGLIIVIQNITLHNFTTASPPPPPGVTSTNSFGATADLFVSRDGGHTFSPLTAPAQVKMLITGRPSGP